jgi:thiol:disulfide interchange protein
MSLHRCLPPRVWLLAGSCLALLLLVFSLSGGGLFQSQLPSLHHDILDDISNATLGVRFSSATANSKVRSLTRSI